MMGEGDKKKPQRLVVTLRHVATQDADARISRAVDILIEAVAIKESPQTIGGTNSPKETPSGQSSPSENSRGSN